MKLSCAIAAVLTLCLSAVRLATADEPVTLNAPLALTGSKESPNGSWCWFEGERAILDTTDPQNPLLLASTVSCSQTDESEQGDIDLHWLNLRTGERGAFELEDRLEADDHNSAAIYRRSDGRYLAMFAGHGMDSHSRWRVSDPGDPSRWGPIKSIDNGAGTTYSNLHRARLSPGGPYRLYNFHRSRNYNPNLHVSDDEGESWRMSGRLLANGSGSTRPYVNYASDGETIHLIATEAHPRDYNTGLYHGVIRNGRLENSTGEVVDTDLSDFRAAPPQRLTRIAAPGVNKVVGSLDRCWGADVEIDREGRPTVLFTARENDSPEDHRLFYARWDGEWRVQLVARMGAGLYPREADYTGLATIDPEEPGTVFVSTPIDPASGREGERYEIYRGRTRDGGATWRWDAITSNSPVDNLRPVVPAGDYPQTVLLWLRGEYDTYRSWTTQLMCLELARQ